MDNSPNNQNEFVFNLCFGLFVRIAYCRPVHVIASAVLNQKKKKKKKKMLTNKLAYRVSSDFSVIPHYELHFGYN